MTGNINKDAEIFIVKMRWLLILGSLWVFWLYELKPMQNIWYVTVFMSLYNGWVHYRVYKHEHTRIYLYIFSIIDLIYVSLLFYLGFEKPVDFHQFYYFLILVLGIRFGMRNYYGLVVLIGIIYFSLARWAGRTENLYPGIIHDFVQVSYYIVFGVLTSFLLLRERVQQAEKEELITELRSAYEQLCLYNAHVEEMAITDPLTGLYNYRFFTARLNQEVEKARRYRRQLSLIILDIDNFKDFNDTYGHPAGDNALKEATTVFRDSIRDLDTLARYGGEEFLVLLPETGTDEAYIVAERIRQAVEKHSFMMSDDLPEMNITVSGGIATYPDHARNAEELLKIADDVLYQAKNKGRNNICRPK